MCLAQGPQHSDAGEDMTSSIKHARIQKSFVRGGQILTIFLVDQGREDPNTIKSRQSLKAFCSRANDGQTLNAHLLLFNYLVTAHFLLTQTMKYSYQCINLSKTQNNSNTPFNLTTLLKVNKIYFSTHKYTYVVISMTGRFSTDYTSSFHVMIGKKPVQ